MDSPTSTKFYPCIQLYVNWGQLVDLTYSYLMTHYMPLSLHISCTLGRTLIMTENI